MCIQGDRSFAELHSALLSIYCADHRDGVYVLPVSKSEVRAVLRAAEEEKRVGDGGNVINTRPTQTARRFFLFAVRAGKGEFGKGSNCTSEDLILVNKGWKNTTRFLEVIRHLNCSLSSIVKITAL